MKKQILLLVLMLLPLMASADDGGTCGDNGNNLTWTFVEETKTLTISGSGSMKNFSYDAPAWRNYRGSIQKVIIEDGVTSLGWYAFMNCYALTTVVGGKDLTSIGNYAFYDCSKLTSFTIGPKVHELGDYMFYRTKITSISIPASVDCIGEKCFDNCASLDTVYIENLAKWCKILFIRSSNPLSKAKHAFVDGQEITDFVIPNNATGISSDSFNGFQGISSVNTGDGVTYIGDGAFRSTSLSTIVLGKNVTSIGCNAFTYCNELRDVYVYAESVPYASPDDDDDHEGSFQRTDLSLATLHVPATLLEAYKTTAPWSQFGSIVEIVPEKCTTPTITYANGQVHFACETEDVEFVPTVTCTPSQLQNGNVLDIGGTFTVSVYATKDGYVNSDIATKIITINKLGDIDGDGQLTVTDVTSLVNAILGK
ncbi:MAG: leucine-rich repeat domain-containing protein [Prevotella sp.]|nr:leucine-rich repeat domain-containing protein [Prevotella sp.]